ncbi:MAG TPA: ABC transporter permease subunit [Candidatus Dormibacteraeota bacterium]|nr:ABC transporter permease subunit [Candidatus Dormibacteraeota bacterium]
MRELAAELYKTVRRPAVWVCVLGLMMIAITIGYAVPWLAETFSKTTQGLPPGTTLADFKVTLYPQNFVFNTVGDPLGGVFALILGVLLQGSEYGWGTVKMLYTQRAGRVSMLAGKLAALAIVVVVMVIGLFAVDAVASVAAALFDGKMIQFPAAIEIVKGIGALSLDYAFWACFGFILATLFRQSAMAIGLGLAYALVVEGLIFGFGAALLSWLKNVQQWFPIANTGYLTDSLGSAKIKGIPESPPPFADATHAVIVLTAYVVVFVVISAVLVRRRDVTS